VELWYPTSREKRARYGAPLSVVRTGLHRLLPWFLLKLRRSLGFAHRFRPTYALANVGHPSISSDRVPSDEIFSDEVPF
jgi:hypothetical protein